MTKPKNRGLGRGLDSIFLDNTAQNEKGNGIAMIRLGDIEPRQNQPRKNFDHESLASLAQSIISHGVIEPIIVRETDRENAPGLYSIIAGERRYRAAKLAKLSEIPAVIVEADDAKTEQIALIENIQRSNLSPIEEAEAYKILLEKCSMTHDQLADSVGKSRSAVTNSLRLLELPKSIKELVDSGELSPGHARAILSLESKNEKNEEEFERELNDLAENIVRSGMSVREAEELVRGINNKDERNEKKEINQKNQENDTLVDYSFELGKKLTRETGRKIKIIEGRKTGKLIIEYRGNDDLEYLVSKLLNK